MSDRRLPVRPNLEQLKHQAKDLLRAIRRGDASAIEEFKQYHPQAEQLTFSENADKMSADRTQDACAPGIKLADVQLVLARSYGAANWPRLVQACKLIDAIWRDDVEAVRELAPWATDLSPLRG